MSRSWRRGASKIVSERVKVETDELRLEDSKLFQ